jgi:NNP family nitrate/nitrite transporter-like MFS transporter
MPASKKSGYRWYVLALATFIFLFSFGMCAACMPVLFSEISAELNLDVVQLGTVWGATFVAGIVVLLFAGILADRFGAKRTLTMACFLAGIFGALRGTSDSYTALLITSFFFGFSIEILPTTVLKTTSLWFEGRSMGMVQGIVCGGMGLGFMLGAMLSATVMSPLLGGWRNVLFLYGGVSIFLGLIWHFTIREPGGGGGEQIVMPPLRQALNRVSRNSNIWLLAITALGFAASQQGANGYIPLYLRGAGWLPANADAALATVNATSAVAVIPLLMLSDRLGLRKAVLMPGLVITTIGTGLFYVFDGPEVWVLAVLLGIFRNVAWATIATMIIETPNIGREYTGTGSGLVLSISRIGFVIGPPLGNSFAFLDPGIPFIFWGALCALSVVAFIFVRETGEGAKRHSA